MDEKCWGLKSKEKNRIEVICWSNLKPEPFDFGDSMRLIDYSDCVVVEILEIRSKED